MGPIRRASATPDAAGRAGSQEKWAAGGTGGSITPLQREIVALLAQGASDDRVARELGIGLRTVQRNVAQLMRVLHVRSRFQAGVAIVRAGWLRHQPASTQTPR